MRRNLTRCLGCPVRVTAFWVAIVAAGGETIRFPDDPAVIHAHRDFGVQGDGVADDTAAPQQAIDTAASAGKTVGKPGPWSSRAAISASSG